MFFKKLSIYEALEKETNPIRKKLLEEYNDKLIFFGEFLIITGMVPETPEKNEYLNRIKLSSEIFHNSNNNNNDKTEVFIKNIDNIYKDWKNRILSLDTPRYLESVKELVLKHLDLEKDYIIKDVMKSNPIDLSLLDKKDDNVIVAANIELRKATIYINNEAKKVGVKPHFDFF